EYTSKDPVHRRWAHNLVTFSMLYSFTENFILPFSHDEVVHGKRAMLDKMPGDVWQKYATLRTLYAYMYGHPGKKLLFMGSEFGQWREWNHDRSLDWHLLQDPAHEGIRRFVQALNYHYRREPALHEVDFEPAGFRWIDCVARLRTVGHADDPAARLPAAQEDLIVRSPDDPITRIMVSRGVAVAVVTFAAFTDILAYSIAVPVLPDISRRFGASPTTI